MNRILGIGLDLVDVDRFALALERHGEPFVARICRDGESKPLAGRARSTHLAGLFAAKEAAMKALGTGFSRGVYWQGIEVVRHHGPPQLQFHAGALERFKAIGATGSLLTLTHSRELSIAHVLLMRD